MSGQIPRRVDLARVIDHTLLAPTATPAQIEAVCRDAAAWGCASACVSPWAVPTAVAAADGEVAVCAVIGFPSGAHGRPVKAFEADHAAAAGAAEIDMVINLGLAKWGAWTAVEEEITAVRLATPGRVLKVIVESATLTDAELVSACRAAEAAGADFVKTSTGFHPSGGASVEAVRIMATAVGGRLGVKASGGVRTIDDAVAMLAAGATRLGCSATAAILEGCQD